MTLLSLGSSKHHNLFVLKGSDEEKSENDTRSQLFWSLNTYSFCENTRTQIYCTNVAINCTGKKTFMTNRGSAIGRTIN
jgi:hypothetical protein